MSNIEKKLNLNMFESKLFYTDLKKYYDQEVVPQWKKQFNVSSDFRVPKLQKIIVNLGVGSAARDSGQLAQIKADIMDLTGQKPIEIRAKKSVAGFSIHKGMVCALKVTLRGKQMINFLQKFTKIALVQDKNFTGFKRSVVQENGSCNLHIRDITCFPEIQYRQKVIGAGINVCLSNSKTIEDSTILLEALGIPFND